MIALLDAGAFVALIARRDKHHEAMMKALPAFRNFYTTQAAITEASHMLGADRGNLIEWIRLMTGRGYLEIFNPDENPDIATIGNLMKKYPRMDYADASLVWLAMRKGVRSILTVDVRDFSVYRLNDGLQFKIFP